jgi:hypothetical protein
MPEQIDNIPSERPILRTDTYEKARNAAPGYDIYGLEKNGWDIGRRAASPN